MSAATMSPRPGFLVFQDDDVAGENAGVNHAIAAHAHGKGLAGIGDAERGGNEAQGFRRFGGVELIREAGGDGGKKRQLYAGRSGARLGQLDAAGMGPGG